ncbi:MAG: rRNA pseudouridine synthase [Clostridiales bacterium]|nr:rRNA pseudouridine synthase [Clostridiales bacterium]
MEMRLDKIISDSGSATRSIARNMISAGRVKVNGIVCKKPESKFDPENCEIKVDNEVISYRRNIYVMMYKPIGVLSATEDAVDKTVISLLPEELQKRGLFPVGRLDKDSEGFLLLTDDGAFAHTIMSPKKHVDKVYFITVDGILTQDDVETFSKGITLSDGANCKPAKLELITDTEAFVTLKEGKYHQVKRMIASCGKKVLTLKRISIGPIELDKNLMPGEWRYLSCDEEKLLKNS